MMTEEDLRRLIPSKHRDLSGLSPDVVNVEELDQQYDRYRFDGSHEIAWYVRLSFDTRIDIGIPHDVMEELFDHVDSVGCTTIYTDGRMSFYVEEVENDG